MTKITLISFFIPFLLYLVGPSLAGLPALRSIAVKGILRCGKVPAANAKVRLFRVYTEPDKNKGKNLLHETMDTKTIDTEGTFELSANNNGRPLNETDMAPAIGIYHKCGEEKKEKYRRVLLKIPPEYVTLGRSPKKVYDVGTLNLELTYPKESL